MSEEKQSQKKRIVTELKHPLPDSKISFDTHFDIISAYVVASNNGKNSIGYKELEPFIKISSTLASGCNKFFKDLGLIEPGEKAGKYKSTHLAEEIHKARQWNNEDLKKSALRKVISNSWFWNQTNQYLQINQTATRDELIQKLGLACGADPKKHHSAIDKLIEYMLFADLIKENDGKFELNEVLETETQIPSSTTEKQEETVSQIQNKPVKEVSVVRGDPVNISIGVLINPDTTEEKIRKTVRIILDEVKQFENTLERGKDEQ